jgi:hypothetical protein
MQKVRTGLFKEVVGRLQGSAESRLLSGRGEESDEAREQRIEGRLGFRVTNGKSLDVARDEGLHGRDEEFRAGYTRGLNEKEIRNGTTYLIDVGHDEHSRLLRTW